MVLAVCLFRVVRKAKMRYGRRKVPTKCLDSVKAGHTLKTLSKPIRYVLRLESMESLTNGVMTSGAKFDCSAFESKLINHFSFVRQ